MPLGFFGNTAFKPVFQNRIRKAEKPMGHDLIVKLPTLGYTLYLPSGTIGYSTDILSNLNKIRKWN
jgi:hypothetical protein